MLPKCLINNLMKCWFPAFKFVFFFMNGILSNEKNDHHAPIESLYVLRKYCLSGHICEIVVFQCVIHVNRSYMHVRPFELIS